MKHIILSILFFFYSSTFANEIKLENAYVKYTTSVNTVAYFTIRNTSKVDQKLIQVSSNIADRVELYTMKPSDFGSKMIPVSEIVIAKNSSVTMAPNGYHIMIFGMKSPLTIKSYIPFRLFFADGNQILLNIPVESTQPKKEIVSMLNEQSTTREEEIVPDHEQMEHTGHEHHVRADMLAPAGVMNPHIHESGKWMIDYRYMGMKMWGLQSGTQGQGDLATLYFPYSDPTVQMPSGSLIKNSPIGSTIPIYSSNNYNYMSVPTQMAMEMNMVSAMTSISDKWMLMFMVPAVANKMTMLSSNFDRAPMSSSGIGDVSFSTAYRLVKTDHQNIFTGMGISLPTGSIDEKDNMPMMGKQKVPYNMQPGVGTYSLLPQISYNGNWNRFSWGAQTQANLRIGKNESNYRFGNRYEISGWISFLMHETVSLSVRIAKQRWLNLQGLDATLDPKMDPQNDPNRQGGMRSDLLIGMNFLMTRGFLQGTRFGFEYGRPFHQNLNGPQLATRELINVFVSFSF